MSTLKIEDFAFFFVLSASFCFNPSVPSGFFYPYNLDESVYYWRGVFVVIILKGVTCNGQYLQCRCWSDPDFCVSDLNQNCLPLFVPFMVKLGEVEVSLSGCFPLAKPKRASFFSELFRKR